MRAMGKGDKKKLVILDTHAILHRAYHALPELSSSKGEPTGGLYGLISILIRSINDLKPDYIVAANDLPGGTFRHEAFDGYKGTRAEIDEALLHQIKRIPEVLEAIGVPLYSAKGFEADDVIGTIVEETKGDKDLTVIIASGDMDTLQLVDGKRVCVFAQRKGLTDIVMYDEEGVQAKYGFGPELVTDFKGIRGDASDNIPGVPGVGEVSAIKLIQTYGPLEKIFAALKKKGVETVAKEAGIQKRYAQLVLDNEEAALFSKGLAEIRRDAPIDFKLPEKPWREGVDVRKAIDTLSEFEFRALIPRIKTLLGVQQSSSEKVPSAKQTLPKENGLEAYSDEGAEAARGPFRREEFAEGDGLFTTENISKEEIEKVGIAVWVLDSNITQPTLDDMYRVGKSDSFEEAKKNILAEIKKRDLSFVYEKIEMPLFPVLRKMEARGVKIDRAFLSDLSKKYRKELDAIAKRIYDAAGEEFNINSPKQLGDILFDKLGLSVKNQKKTATGARSTRESELEKMRELHPVIGDILSFRELSKLLSTYIDTIPTLLDSEDRLHTSYVQTGTTTGRLASQNPNLQNIPIKTDLGRAIRHAFVPSEDMQLVSFDYSQIELRIAAFLSGDEALSEIFRSGRDVHREVAARVFHVKDSEVSYEQRRRAKVINFGILYGMGVTSLQQALGTNRKEAQEFYDQYFAAFPRLAAYLDETKATAARQGYTETFFGRRRYFDGIKSSIPYVKAAAERMAINAPIQGTQADIVKLAMVEIAQWIEKEKLGDDIHMLLQVHDELVFEMKESAVQKYAHTIKELMENIVSEEERDGIPYKAEGKRGPNWGDMEELPL